MNFSKSDGEGVLNQSNHILNREYYQLQYLDVTKAFDSNIILHFENLPIPAHIDEIERN